MNRLFPLFRNPGKKRLRGTLTLLACVAVAGTVIGLASRRANEYVSASPAITQRFSGVTSEKMLLDFCSQLQTLQGVTGVSYRDYDPAGHSVTLTVYYNPRVASPRQLKIFLEHSAILWVPPRSI